jgi:Tfp pilus assembly protein PilV
MNQTSLQTRRLRRLKRGMTLVEVMMGALVLTLVFISTFSVMQRGFEMVDISRNTGLAGQILQSEIEDIRLKNWANLPADGTTSIDLPSAFNAVAAQFSATRTVSSVNSDMKKVTVQVSWTAYTGRTHTRRYETYYTKGGLNDYYVSNRS